VSQKSTASVHFEEQGSELRAVEIGSSRRAPVISSLHRALLALGIVVSSYHVRAGASGLVERVVLERRDGGAVTGSLSAATRAAILPLLLNESQG
jgi:hypothetical protein